MARTNDEIAREIITDYDRDLRELGERSKTLGPNDIKKMTVDMQDRQYKRLINAFHEVVAGTVEIMGRGQSNAIASVTPSAVADAEDERVPGFWIRSAVGRPTPMFIPRKKFMDVWRKHKYINAAAARELGIHDDTFRRIMRENNLQKPMQAFVKPPVPVEPPTTELPPDPSTEPGNPQLS